MGVRAIRTDNGAPFDSTALAGLSPLAVWGRKLGIVPEGSRPGIRSKNGPLPMRRIPNRTSAAPVLDCPQKRVRHADSDPLYSS